MIRVKGSYLGSYLDTTLPFHIYPYFNLSTCQVMCVKCRIANNVDPNQTAPLGAQYGRKNTRVSSPLKHKYCYEDLVIVPEMCIFSKKKIKK